MGVKSFFLESKVKVSPSRLFKVLVTEAHDVYPKSTSIESFEIVDGHKIAPGSICKTKFSEGAPYKYAKNRVDTVDPENYICKFTLVEGDVLGNKLEKICQEMKFEATEDGGCVVKLAGEYHMKGDYQVSDEEIKTGKELAERFYKTCEEYLLAHPDVCA